jgi:lipopolysaccharide transport system ATP-binding protein
MSPVIKVENLSKRYFISHQKREPYLALRDVIAEGAKRFRHRVTHLLSGAHSPSPATKEEFWALKDVSFEVEDGESVGIIGRNGAGKSTLLKILSRITEPTGGRARIRGRLASLLEVGTGFHPELTGKENIYLNGAILGMGRAEIARKFDEIVSFSGVERFLDTPVKHYSSGMRVRLAFSVAAHLEPDILIVDEVLSVGDLDFQQKCMGKMEGVTKDGRTVIMVSHDLAAIHRLCKRVILLDQGSIVLDSNTDDVIQTYVSHRLGEQSVYAQQSQPEKSINLRKAYLSNAHGTPALEFRFNEKISLNIEYEINTPIKNGCVWFSLHTMQDAVAFGSADTDEHDGRLGEERQPGYYRASVELSDKWLNAGRYFVVVGITSYFPLTEFDRVEILNFTILDVGTPEKIRTGYSRPGILQPFLKWETTAVIGNPESNQRSRTTI